MSFNFFQTADLTHSIHIRPLPSSILISPAILSVLFGNIGHQGVIRVGFRQHGQNGQERLGNSKRRRPSRLQNINTDEAVCIDIRVINLRGEHNPWGFERIIYRKVNGHIKQSARIR